MPITETTESSTTQSQKKMSRTRSFRVGAHITLTVSLKSLIVGGCIAVALLLLTLLHTDRFLNDELTNGKLMYTLCLIASVFIGVIAAARINLPRKADAIANTIVVLLLPIVAMAMVECLNGVNIWDWSARTLILNYILYMLFYGTVYVLSGSYRLPMVIINVLLFILALTNFYVKAFRGTPFLPIDLYAAGTAANVASAYDFSFNYQVVISIVMLAFLLVVGVRLRTPRLSIIAKVASRVFFAVLTVCIVSIYLFTDLYAQAGLSPDFWSQNRGYRRTGVLLNFCLNTKYNNTTKPANYDADEISDIVYNVIGDDTQTAPESTVTPNIICIMNESLSDLSVLGDLQTNIDYMPFLSSLTENTVRGNLYVPVVGASTSNTEFEFLTGAPMSFFPAGSNAYMLYVNNPLYSLVSTLGGQNYSKLAFHPYYASGWNRTAVYNYFGFSRFLSIGSVIDRNILITYQDNGYNAELLQSLVDERYPGEDILLRRYVSDSYNYKKIIQQYERRDESQPFFVFNVTMQNHGGYTEVIDNFTEDVYVSGIGGNTDESVTTAYPKANQYLSLIKASDEAFKELVNYFEAQDEPTIICMFGDHQPNVEDEFVEALLGGDTDDLSTEQMQKQYITPFYIWANYDIEEKTIDRLGVNYLSSYLLQIAGVELPAYNQYLLKLSETLPVINTVGVIDADGNHYALGEDTPYDDLIDDYKKVVYNLVFDEDNRCDTLYTVN